MKKPTLKDIIFTHAKLHQLNPQLIAAVIWQESKGKTFAVRYEEGFFAKYLTGKSRDKLGGHWPSEGVCSFKTELRLRSTSFGLMQVMGQVAREVGFKGDYLTELCDPELGVQFGCLKLADCLEREGDTQSGLLRYNGGGDKDYANKVFAHMDSGVIDALFIR